MERRRLADMPRCNHGRVHSALFALLFALNAHLAHADDVQYVYDELGRLVQATNLTAGQAIEYRYDPAGNIISQNAVSLSTLSTGYVSNPAGTVGSQVTINGTGFSTNPAGNIVTFNGVQATVISATQTQLVVIVPAGATSGPINVQVGATAVSAGAFAVTASGNTPTITALNPAVGTVATRIAVTGTNFDVTPSNDRVRFNTMLASVPSSNSTTINTSVPTGAGSGKVQVTTPRGVAVSPMDFIVVPSGYSASSIGSTGRFAADGSPATISLPTAGRISVQLFDGNVGDLLTLGATNVSIASASIKVFKPDGTSLTTGTITASGQGIQFYVVPFAIAATVVAIHVLFQGAK